jgi:hypothetical protein
VVSAARALNVIGPEPMWLKSPLTRSAPRYPPGPALRTPDQVSPGAARAIRQRATISIIDGGCLGRRCGRAADDHRTNSPRSGQIQPHHLSVMIAPFLVISSKRASKILLPPSPSLPRPLGHAGSRPDQRSVPHFPRHTHRPKPERGGTLRRDRQLRLSESAGGHLPPLVLGGATHAPCSAKPLALVALAKPAVL